MPKSRPRYAESYRADAVQLVQTSGKRVRQIAADLGIATESLRRWV